MDREDFRNRNSHGLADKDICLFRWRGHASYDEAGEWLTAVQE
jgi:hypothetical protein